MWLAHCGERREAVESTVGHRSIVMHAEIGRRPIDVVSPLWRASRSDGLHCGVAVIAV